MTREVINELKKYTAGKKNTQKVEISVLALNRLIFALEDQEMLTDKEQRIFLAAMGREEKICKEVCADGDGVDLVNICRSIENKVKKALWV